MKIFLLNLIAIAIVLNSCDNNDSINQNFLTDSSLTYGEKMELYLKTDSIADQKFSKSEVKLLREYYKLNKYKPILTDEENKVTQKGQIYLDLIENSLVFGVPKLLMVNKFEKLHPIEKDFFTLIHLHRLIFYRSDGFLKNKNSFVIPKFTKELSRKTKIILGFKTKEEGVNYILSLGPMQNETFKSYSEKIYSFGTKYLIDTLNLNAKNYATPEQKLELAKSSLAAKGYLKKNSSDKVEFDRAMLSFKLDNGLDSTVEINEFTVKALCESNENKLFRAAISLDRIRKRTSDLKRYVLINIPEYHLYFFAKGELKAKHRIIVGKRGTQTPELTSEIRSITIYPYWKVPASIVKNEIMPKVRKSVAYLEKHHYTLAKINDTNALDLTKVNLNSNSFSVIQSPGKWNSLGVIKFEFNNKHNVYVHDTPQKGLFNRTIRSFSHGCMRCERPIDLGKTFIEFDQEFVTSKERKPYYLDTLLNRNKHTSYFLTNKIPIFVEYQSVTVARSKLIFHLDIYDRDNQIIADLRRNSKII